MNAICSSSCRVLYSPIIFYRKGDCLSALFHSYLCGHKAAEWVIIVKKKNIMPICILVVIVLLLVVIWMKDNVRPDPAQVSSLSDCAYSELKDSTYYNANEVMVVDHFATSLNNGNNTAYYLVTFRDADDRLVAAILSVDNDNDIYGSIINNSRGYVVNGYVKTWYSGNAELTQYFHEALKQYADILNEDPVSPQWILAYVGTNL